MQLKSPVNNGNTAAANPAFLASNTPPSGAVESGGASAFAKLMESQAGNLARSAAVRNAPPPAALAAHAQGTGAPEKAGNGNGDGSRDTASSADAGKPPEEQNAGHATHGAQETAAGSRALARQQAERNRLNAQRETRATANRAAAPSDKAQPGHQAKAASADPSSPQTDADAREEDKACAEDTGPQAPQALLDWIHGASAAAHARAGVKQAPRPEEDPGAPTGETAVAPSLAATALVASTAGAQPAATANTPVAADPPADAAGLPGAGRSPSGKASHHGLQASRDASTPAGPQPRQPNGKESAGDNASAVALPAEMSTSKAGTGPQQAEWLATTAAHSLGPQSGDGATSARGADAANASALAAAVGSHATAAAQAPGATVSVNIPTPVQSPEFREMLGAQVSLLARDGVQEAELHLNPGDMGPISVQITLDGTQARVDFGADSAETRRLIESGLPELASALRDAGLTLSGGGVSQHAPQQQQQGRAGTGQGGDGSRSGPDVDRVSGASAQPARSAATARRVALGGVDVYA